MYPVKKLPADMQPSTISPKKQMLLSRAVKEYVDAIIRDIFCILFYANIHTRVHKSL